MKLTREQVSQLSDLELNRGMVWCYPKSLIPEHSLNGRSIICYDGYRVLLAEAYVGYEYLPSSIEINYLTDYNLTMPLAFENKLSIFEELDLYAVEVAPLNQSIIRLANKNPLRAICEVLLMIAMERE